jgi:hypothetical protein
MNIIKPSPRVNKIEERRFAWGGLGRGIGFGDVRT